ncbi:sulfurtransferase TusA family protein [Elusimicrobiota bacterium]
MSGRKSLDLRGVRCPENSSRALMRLGAMRPGEELELFVDDGEPIEKVLRSLEFEGYPVLSESKLDEGPWRVLVRIPELDATGGDAT